jgi:hypothetical protein
LLEKRELSGESAGEHAQGSLSGSQGSLPEDLLRAAPACPRLALFSRHRSGAPCPTDFIRALAHPVLEATGVSAHATIVALTGSNDAPDERVLPPVPMAARPNRGPYYIYYDSIIKHPSSDSSLGKLAIFF